MSPPVGRLLRPGKEIFVVEALCVGHGGSPDRIIGRSRRGGAALFMRRQVERCAIAAARGEAVLELPLVAQGIDEIIGRNDENRANHQADQRGAPAAAFIRLVRIIAHVRHTAGRRPPWARASTLASAIALSAGVAAGLGSARARRGGETMRDTKPPTPTSLSVREAARAIAAKRLGVAEYISARLAAIEAREAVVGAWQVFDHDRVMEAARRRDREPPGGPLHGIPLAVKDVIDTFDLPTTYGSPIYAGHRPAADAACVALARASGAVVLGKTVSTEFAYFTPGKTTNPHNPAHTPGGSSSGSAAAVGAGMAPLAFGTQTAGSILRPASYCGVVGYKPSFGLVPRAGVKVLADSLDTVGVLARNVEDAAFFIGVLTDRRALRDVEALLPPRIGFCRTPMWDDAEPATIAALDRARSALLAAGARIDEIPVPDDHQGLVAAHDTIMSYEMTRALAD